MTEATAQIIFVAIITALPGILMFLAQIRTDANKGLRELVDALQKQVDGMEENQDQWRQRAEAAEKERDEYRQLLEDTRGELREAKAAIMLTDSMRLELNKYKQWGILARRAMQKAGIDVPRFPDTGELTEPRKDL